ncbi:hypothetical protein AAC387_Pa09g1514 [Persea americana]
MRVLKSMAHTFQGNQRHNEGCLLSSNGDVEGSRSSALGSMKAPALDAIKEKDSGWKNHIILNPKSSKEAELQKSRQFRICYRRKRQESERIPVDQVVKEASPMEVAKLAYDVGKELGVTFGTNEPEFLYYVSQLEEERRLVQDPEKSGGVANGMAT